MTIRQPPLISLLVFCTYEVWSARCRIADALRLSAASPGHKKFMPRLSSSCINQIISRRLPVYRHHRRSDSYAIPPRWLHVLAASVRFWRPYLSPHQIKSPHAFFMLSVRNMAILLCLCDIVQGMLFTPETRAVPRHLRAEKARFLCTHGSLTDPAAMRAGRVKSRSKKLCKFVHFCAGKHAYIFDRGLPLM